MGCIDCVADNQQEYINIATRLACDPVFRSSVVQRIEQGRAALWREDRVISEFASFFTAAAASYPALVDY
jgi:predicted O-linked N-acetylglucosamine transferase (SPINDLY family)